MSPAHYHTTAATLQKEVAALCAHTSPAGQATLQPAHQVLGHYLTRIDPAWWAAPHRTAAAALLTLYQPQTEPDVRRRAAAAVDAAREQLVAAMRVSALSRVQLARDGRIEVVVTNDPELTAATASIPGCRRVRRHTFSCPATAFPEIAGLAGRYGIVVHPAVAAAVAPASDTPTGWLTERRNGDLQLRFPHRDVELVSLAKAIAGRWWDPTARANVFPRWALPDLLTFAANHEIVVDPGLLRIAVDHHNRQPQATLDDDRRHVVIDGPENPELSRSLRMYNHDRPTWDRDRRAHRVPLAAGPAELAALLSRFDLHADDHVRAAALEESERQRRNIATSRAPGAEPVAGDDLGVKLLAYQHAGVRAILRHRRLVMADPAGNAVQALAAVHRAHAYPAVVVCPPENTTAWADLVTTVLPSARVQIVNPRHTRQPDGQTVVILPSSLLTVPSPPRRRTAGSARIRSHAAGRRRRRPPRRFAWVDRLAGANPGAVLLDGLRTGTAGDDRARAVVQLTSAAVANRGLVVELGAAAVTDVGHLHDQLAALHRLDEVGGADRLLVRYGGAGQDRRRRWRATTARHTEELDRRLRAAGLLVARDEATAQIHPATPEWDYLEVADLDEEALAAYRVAESALVRALVHRARIRAGRRRVDLTDEGVLNDACEPTSGLQGSLNELRRLAAVAKVPALTRVVSGDTVVFAHHRAVTDVIAATLGGGRLFSGQRAADRAAVIGAFQRGDTQLLVASCAAATTLRPRLGPTVTAVQAEVCWTPGEYHRVVRLLSRPSGGSGRHRMLLARGTIDEVVLMHLADKPAEIPSDQWRAASGGIVQRLMLARTARTLLTQHLEATSA